MGEALMHKQNSIFWPLVTLSLCFIVSLYLFWPGVVSPDGLAQYAAAKSGLYTDHHPPAMSFLWRYLDMIYAGPGLMLLLHLGMLYAASVILVIIFRHSHFKWLFAIYPLIPNVFSYSALIVKDVGFSYAYLLSGAILAYLMVNKTSKYKYFTLSFVVILLFYGTAVKYQAKFLLVFLTLGIGYCVNYKYTWRGMLTGVVLYLIILQSVLSFNSYLVPNAQGSYSWQLVKLYDLSAISLQLNKPMYPQFVLENPNFNFKKIQTDFSPREVDPLVFVENSVLISGRNETQRQELLAYWRQTVTRYPWLYIKSRAKLWSYNFTSEPGGRTHPLDFFNNTKIGDFLHKPAVYALIDNIYQVFKVLLRFIWLVPLLLFYTYLSIAKLRATPAATPLLMFSMASVTLLVVLFFFSMAATARYVFICTCFIHASHGFAYECWLARKKS